MNNLKRVSGFIALSVLCGAAFAKLPAPSEEAKAAAAAAKEKAAWSTKVAAYQLCLAQNRVAERYGEPRAESAAQMPPCTDPGPYVPAQAAANVGVADAKPVPSAGAPAAAAAAPAPAATPANK